MTSQLCSVQLSSTKDQFSTQAQPQAVASANDDILKQPSSAKGDISTQLSSAKGDISNLLSLSREKTSTQFSSTRDQFSTQAKHQARASANDDISKQLKSAKGDISTKLSSAKGDISTQTQTQATTRLAKIKEHFPHRKPVIGRKQLNLQLNHKHLHTDEVEELSFSPEWISTPKKPSKVAKKAKRIVTFNFNPEEQNI